MTTVPTEQMSTGDARGPNIGGNNDSGLAGEFLTGGLENSTLDHLVKAKGALGRGASSDAEQHIILAQNNLAALQYEDYVSSPKLTREENAYLERLSHRMQSVQADTGEFVSPVPLSDFDKRAYERLKRKAEG